MNCRFHPLARTSVALNLFLCALVAAGPAMAESGCTEAVPSTPPFAPSVAAPSNAASPPTASAGLRVHIDPHTGELLDHPPEGEISEPQPEPPVAVEDIPVEVRPDGTVVADIGDRYQMALHAQIVDGKLVTCHRPVSEEAGEESATEGSDAD